MTPRLLYLNHAGTSWPKPAAVVEAVQQAMSVSPRQWPTRFTEAHRAIAGFFGLEHPEPLLLTPGCTSALAVGISDVRIPRGQHVLTSCWEHHALHRPLLKRAATGMLLETIPPKRDHDGGPVEVLDLDWLEQRLARQDVALVAITAACNVTGERLPFEDVVELAHRYEAMVLVDAAQIVGWQPLDLPRLNADLVAFGGHKGLQAPWGIGGLYVSDRARMECTSAVCELPVPGGDQDAAPLRPDYCDVGSVDQFALAGLHAAVETLRQRDRDADLSRGRQQIRRLRQTLQRIEGVRVIGPSQPERALPSLAFEVHGVPSAQIAAQLRQRHQLVLGSGRQCAPLAHQTLGSQDAGLLRLSVGVGQPEDEIDEAAERLVAALA